MYAENLSNERQNEDHNSELRYNRREVERLICLLQNKEATIKRMNHWIESLEIENKKLLEKEKERREKWENTNEKLIYWRKRSVEQSQELEEMRIKCEEKHRMHRKEINEVLTEIKWHKGKVRVLEKALEESNRVRLECHQIQFERVKEITEDKKKIEIEVTKLKIKRDDDEWVLQNFQNTVRQLLIENQRLREKCEEPLPGVNSMENYREPLSNRERTVERALLSPPPTILESSTNIKRDFHCRRDARRQAEIGLWPYSRADEIIFWNQ